MSKKKANVQVNTNEEVKESVEIKEENQNVEEVTTEKTEDEIKRDEMNKKIEEYVKDMKGFVEDYQKYHNITPLENLRTRLTDLQRDENLDADGKKYLSGFNRAIYAKIVRAGEEMPERPRTHIVRSFQEKLDMLSDVANGYGDRATVTTIDDLKEKSFYCIKEKIIDNEKKIVDTLKITFENGIYNIDQMSDEEANKMKEMYKELNENQDEERNVMMSIKVIKNDPKYATNYFNSICNGRRLEAEEKNKEQEQVEEEVAET